MEFDQMKVIDEIEKIWLRFPRMAQGDIAKDIGLSAFSFRKFLKGNKSRFKVTTQMRLLAWIEKMKGKDL